MRLPARASKLVMIRPQSRANAYAERFVLIARAEAPTDADHR
jgi:hypothetical protein